MSDNQQTPDAPEVDDTEGVEDFDAFWSSRERKRKRVKIAGETIDLPPSLPLQFELEARALQRSKNQRDVTRLLGILGFPEDAMERWAAAGMDLEQFTVLLAWAPQVIAGKAITLAEAADQVAAQEAAKGKAPARKS